MRSAVLWLAVLLTFVLASEAGSQTETIQLAAHTFIVPGGAVEGGDALLLPHGDVLNVRRIMSRNVQGGTSDNPNLDFGAGSATHRGTLSLNYDVGRCVYIYDGHAREATKTHHLIAAFCPGKRPWFNRQPRIGGRPPS